MSRVLVLGSNSFSGASVVKEFLDLDFEVFGLSRSPEVPNCYSPYHSSRNLSRFQFKSLGSNFDPKQVIDICNKYNIRKVLNFSAQSMVSQSWDSPQDWYETNCVWLSKLVNEFSSWGKLEKFIQFSTPEVYGSTEGWVTENFNFNPSTPYAISRAASDFHLRAMQKAKDFPVVFTRAANIYGPGQPKYRIVPRAILSGMSRQQLPLHGEGKSKRSFIFADDVSKAIVRILDKGTVGDTYHISTTHVLEIRDLVFKIAEILDIPFDSFVKFVPELPGKDNAYLLDSTKLRDELGWSDVTNLERGLDLTISWAKQYYKELEMLPSNYIHRS